MFAPRDGGKAAVAEASQRDRCRSAERPGAGRLDRRGDKKPSRREAARHSVEKERYMTISEKVAYIQGLYDGLGLDEKKSGEARILSEVLDVLREVGQQLEGMDAAMDQFDEELDTLEDTVSELEDAVFDDEDEEDEESCGFGGEDGEDFFEIPCPTCGEDLLVDDEALAAGVVDCPVCGGKFALSFEDGEDGADSDE